jgi:hypothetical protein
LLLQQAQLIAASGVKVAVVLGPSEPMVNDALRSEILSGAGADPTAYDLGLPQRIIAELMRTSAPDVPLLDLTLAFRAEHEKTNEQLYFRRNTHWDKAGNQLAGDQIADFLSLAWFGLPVEPESLDDADWPGPVLVSEAQLKNYLKPLLTASARVLPEVSGAARVMQLFDGITGQSDNWAMAELQQPILLTWPTPVDISNLQIYLHNPDGRNYGLLVEVRVAGSWRTIADHTADPVSGMLEISLPGTPVQELRLTGTSNSDQQYNPANTYIHIEELEWR